MEEQRNHVIELLNERLETHDNNRREVQDKLHEICNEMRKQIDCFENSINKEIEELFSKEDNRLQCSLNSFRESTSTNDDVIYKLIERARTELLLIQSYDLIRSDPNKPNLDFTKTWKLKTERKLASLKSVDFEERKPFNFTPSLTDKGAILLFFAFFNDEEINILKSFGFSSNVVLAVWEKGRNEETAKTLTKEYKLGEQIYFANPFPISTTYYMKMRIEHKSLSSKWSDKVELATPDINMNGWEKCPDDVGLNRKYSVDVYNPTIATKASYGDNCTIIGSTPLPLGMVPSWNIKILKSEKNDGASIYIGVAPFNINLNEYGNYNKCGWYFYCCDSMLYSGPPHKYTRKEYGGLRKKDGDYVHTGDSVGVVMDTTKGELSFVMKGINFGVAYEKIPLDKPLVPCVILWKEGDSVELDLSEVKEVTVNQFIRFPSNIVANSYTWDSITITWDDISDVLFYQIEVDGSIFSNEFKTNTFTKRGFPSESEHSFRIRTVKGGGVSEWSDVVKGRVMKMPEFTNSVWRKCNIIFTNKIIDKKHEYIINENNPRIAVAKYSTNNCTLVGDVPLPLNKVSSWNIKILKSCNNDGKDIYVGVAPFDINQNEDFNYKKCGWYFYCYDSTLYSGPPHNFNDKKYGLRKGNGRYVRTKGSVGIMMDTTKGELSFGLKGVNLGVAYEGIPLDKPLMPCVLLGNKGDFVELCISGDDNESCVIS